MATEVNTGKQSQTAESANNAERKSSVVNDLPDSDRDLKELEAETVTMDLPDVKDIPGQEFVHVPNLGEMADTTASSDDEEGANIEGLLDDDDAIDDDTNNEFDVTEAEKQTLADDMYMPTRDEDNLRRARMDNVDFEGEPLNEESFGVGQSLTGAGIDSGEMVDETQTEALGQGDEENKEYSLEDTDTDQPSENRTGA